MQRFSDPKMKSGSNRTMAEMMPEKSPLRSFVHGANVVTIVFTIVKVSCGNQRKTTPCIKPATWPSKVTMRVPTTFLPMLWPLREMSHHWKPLGTKLMHTRSSADGIHEMVAPEVLG